MTHLLLLAWTASEDLDSAKHEQRSLLSDVGLTVANTVLPRKELWWRRT